MNPFKFYGSFTKPLPFPCLPMVFYMMQLQKIIFRILISVNQKKSDIVAMCVRCNPLKNAATQVRTPRLSIILKVLPIQ
jgi:hypothetical protein